MFTPASVSHDLHLLRLVARRGLVPRGSGCTRDASLMGFTACLFSFLFLPLGAST